MALLVGDVHATPDELEDCERLLTLVDTAGRSEDFIIFMGDQYNTHDVVNTRCIEFWRRWFAKLQTNGRRVIALRGNHDQVNPTTPFPHSLLVHPEVIVVDRPQHLPLPLLGCAAMPYFASNEEFVVEANKLHSQNPSIHTIFCHQTFQGASYENGFYAKDAVELSKVTVPNLISGHIHTPQKVGKAFYVGAPRWRTRADANIDRFIYHIDTSDRGLKLASKVPTSNVCRKIWSFHDKPDLPLDVGTYHQNKDKLYVDVFGPTEKYVRERETELKAQFGAVTRGFAVRTRRDAVSEVDGIEVAFSKFASHFTAPNGTSIEVLNSMLEQRLVAE